jgi:tryptophanyl-tRNA synthetase
LSMVTPLGWLERVPTYKEALENVKDKDLHNYGFLGYPVLQCADIVMYGEPGARLVVPVGEDQVSHVEISREIVRRFNGFNGLEIDEGLFLEENAPALKAVWSRVPDMGPPDRAYVGEEVEGLFRSGINRYAQAIGLDNFLHSFDGSRPKDEFQSALKPEWRKYFRVEAVLAEPEAMLTPTPRIPGLDGRKMSKSYGNTIMLSGSDADIRAKTKVMVTDPARKRRTDPGNPDVCPVYDWHKLFAPKNAVGEYTAEGKATLEWAATGCRTAGIGCIECKAAMAENLIKWIAPVRERRVKWEKDPKGVLEILDEGSRQARAVAQRTMQRVREAVFGWDKKRAEISNSAMRSAQAKK